jgi:hypothetical protein
LTTSALMEDAIMIFLGYGPPVGRTDFYLRQQLERPQACVLHHAKPFDYNSRKNLVLPSA